MLISMCVLGVYALNQIIRLYAVMNRLRGTTPAEDLQQLVDGMTVSADAEGDPDIAAVLGMHFNNTCFLLCEIQSVVNGGDERAACGELCSMVHNSMLGGESDCVHSIEVSENDQEESASTDLRNSMEHKYVLYKLFFELLKLCACTVAFYCFWGAATRWKSVRESTPKVAVGWAIIFGAPLFVSLFPWYNVLGFSEEFEDKHMMEQVPGQLKGFMFKLKLGTSVYVATQAMALALFRSALDAVVVCKTLVPRCGLWSQLFALTPLLQVVLQWPMFGALQCRVFCSDQLYNVNVHCLTCGPV